MTQHLPRFFYYRASYLIILLLLVTVPHFTNIPTWSSFIIISLSVWRSLIELKYLVFPNRFFMAVLTVSLAFIVYQNSGGFSGIRAGTHLLLVMAFCKLVESRTHRDYMLLVMVSFFIIATNFLFTQTIQTALYMLLCLLFALVTLIIINQKNDTIHLKYKFKLATKMMIYSLPVMLILFVFFPRINGPLWRTGDDTTQARTGLSDTMTPGQISQLIYSNELAFRARFEDRLPLTKELYWRALTLWNFDGQRWTRGEPLAEDSEIIIRQPGYQYTVTAEPSQRHWLYLLDLPYQISTPHNLHFDFTAKTAKKISKRLRYNATSTTDFIFSGAADATNLQLALHTPDLNPRTQNLVKQWQRESANAEDLVKRATTFFAKENFYYTLSPAQLTRLDAIDQFLFETREGFCEHYASAFAIMMRHAGIPSRIVLGYLGGEFNAFNREYAIDQSMAHAWTEVWLADQGWVRVDPTAAIAPQRVETSLASALQGQANIPLHLRLNHPVFQKFRQLFDAIDSSWNQWVLNYNEQNQQKLLQLLTGKNLNLTQVGYFFLPVLLTTLAITVLFYFFKRTGPPLNPVQRAYQQFCLKLQRAGLAKLPSEGPIDYRDRLVASIPHLSDAIGQITTMFIQLEYGKLRDEQTSRNFIHAVRKFRVVKKQ